MLRKSRLTICIDETAVGNFIELEGERHEIVRFAKALGYGRADFITSKLSSDLLAGREGTGGAA